MCFKPLFPVIEYVLNYEHIAKVLCENRDKPELECNGQCYLMKNLAEEAGNDIPAERKTKPGFEVQIVFLTDPERHEIGHIPLPATGHKIPDKPNSYSYLFNLQLLKPPIS